MVFSATQVYKPGSVLTVIYLVSQLLAKSSRLPGTVGSTLCSSTALLRIEFTAPQCSHEASALLPHFFTMTGKTGYIFLLHLSWGHPRRALPVILTLWSPDFPHPDPVGDPAATVQPGCCLILQQKYGLVKYLAKSVFSVYTVLYTGKEVILCKRHLNDILLP